MFKVLKNECYLKGIEVKQPGTFKTEDGRELAYDGYTQVIISIKDKNGKYMDLKTRVPNNTEAQQMVSRLGLEVPLMNKFNGDFEIQFSAAGAAKVFLVGFSVIK